MSARTTDRHGDPATGWAGPGLLPWDQVRARNDDIRKDRDVPNTRHRGADEAAAPFLPIRRLDIVFMIYDEPRVDAYWADLREKRPAGSSPCEHGSR